VKKRSTGNGTEGMGAWTVGMDLGDRTRLNTVRGLLREFGVTIAEGAERVQPALVEALSQAPSPVPEALHAALLGMMAEARELDERSGQVDKQLKALARAVPLVERLETIPGVGLLNATAFPAMVGNFPRFKSGRRFASSLGLTPAVAVANKLARIIWAVATRGEPFKARFGAQNAQSDAHA